MHRQIVILLIILINSPILGDEKKPADPIKELQGTWQATGGERSGMKVPDDAIKGATLKIEGDTFTFLNNGNPEAVLKFKLDSTKKPAHIDVTAVGGDMAGQTFPGIYKLEGDTLTLAIHEVAKPTRPREFKSPGGGNITLFVCKRVKGK